MIRHKLAPIAALIAINLAAAKDTPASIQATIVIDSDSPAKLYDPMNKLAFLTLVVLLLAPMVALHAADASARKPNIYRDYTARADLAVGSVLQALRDLNLEDNTVVIFTSDNGSMWGAHGLSGKWNMYEESIRVPLMIRDPRLPAGTRSHRRQMVLNIDIASTIVAMAGLPVPTGMQGMDLSPILRDPEVRGRTDWYYEHDVGSESKGKPLPRCEGVRSEQWKYIRYKDTQPLQQELFDLQNDPLEENNLANEAAHALTLAKMSARCDKLREELR